MLPGRREAPTTADRLGPQNMLHGGHGRGAVALLEGAPAVLGQSSRKGDLELAGCRADLDGKTGVAERPDHLVVSGQHHRGEMADAFGRRRLRELREQQSGDPPTLPVVGDGEGDLRGPGAIRDVLPLADDQPVIGSNGEETRATTLVGEPARHPADIGGSAEESEPAGLVGELAQEALDPLDVLRSHLPDVDGRAIA